MSCEIPAASARRTRAASRSPCQTTADTPPKTIVSSSVARIRAGVLSAHACTGSRASTIARAAAMNSMTTAAMRRRRERQSVGSGSGIQTCPNNTAPTAARVATPSLPSTCSVWLRAVK
jgi:hypothetical protein